MYKKVLYRKAYRLLENCTPLKFDCGLLCSNKCCSGDRNSGMLLFPGEEIMFRKEHHFLEIRKESLNGMDVAFGVCRGICNRRLRPLSCRIFPLVPYLDLDGGLSIIEDPRARYLCPLLWEDMQVKVDKVFKRKIFRVFQTLIQDEDIRTHLISLSVVLNDYTKFVK